jgi:hypothetical protein
LPAWPGGQRTFRRFARIEQLARLFQFAGQGAEQVGYEILGGAEPLGELLRGGGSVRVQVAAQQFGQSRNHPLT